MSLFKKGNNKELHNPEGREIEEADNKTLRLIISAVCLAFAVFGILTNSFFYINSLKKAGMFLGFTLCLIFLLYPTRIRGKALLPFDLLLSVLGLCCGLYTVLVTDRFAISNLVMTPMDLVMSILAITLVVIATKKAVGNAMAVLPVLFALYALLGKHIPGIFGHGGFSVRRFFMRMYMVDEGVYGMATQVASSYVFLFILFGGLLNASGVSALFTDCAMKIAGSRPGGPAKVSIISSGLMGTISGSSAANVATTGAFTIPLMIKNGFEPAFAGSVEAVASTGGMIMPPIMGSAAFLMVQYLGVPYSRIVLAAIIPAFLYYLSVYMWVHFKALRAGIKTMEKGSIPPIADFARRSLLFLPLIAIVVSMLVGYTAIFSAFVGMVVTLFAWLLQREHPTVRKLLAALESGVKSSLTSMMACIAAGIIVGVCNMTGLGQVLTYNIVKLSGGSLLVALLLTAFACIILSMGLPAAACYILVATIVAASLTRMGAVAIAAHMFVFYFSCYSNITPPVAIASYTAAGLAGAKPMDVALWGLKVAAPGFIIPFLLVFNPILLLENYTIPSLCFTTAASILGVIFMAIAGVGYLHSPLNLLSRSIFFAASLLLIVPETITSIIGAVMIVVGIVVQKAAETKRAAV